MFVRAVLGNCVCMLSAPLTVCSMDCVSIGPEIKAAHTPEECLLIPSVNRFYTLLKESLAELAQTH